MKAKELMIGDWVQVPSEMNRYKRVCSTFDMDSAVLYRPIPLTSELLEKNGFERVTQSGCANPYHWMLEKYEEESDGLLFRIKAFNNPFRGMFVSIDNPSACETISFGKQIEFVHELQHALRICEIELDIKLEG